MKSWLSTLLRCTCLCLLSAASATVGAVDLPDCKCEITRDASGVRLEFDVQKLAPGVYAVVQRSAAVSNSVFIVGETDVTVIQPPTSEAAGRDVLGALHKLTDKPVRQILSFADAATLSSGDRVYQSAYPKAEFVSVSTLGTPKGKILGVAEHRLDIRTTAEGRVFLILPDDRIFIISAVPLEQLPPLNPKFVVPEHGPIFNEITYREFVDAVRK